jgi:UDP-glucose 4-epimerase
MNQQTTLAGKRIMVTGGAGFIGSHLVDRLIDERPERIIVVDNLFLGRRENLFDARNKLGTALREVCLEATDFDRMRELLEVERVEVVFELAVIPLPASLENPRWCVDENVKLTSVICELQRLGLFQKLVHFSSSEVYGTATYVPIDEKHPYVPSTPYAASKLGGDQIALSYAHTFDLDVCILRPFNNLGPRQNDRSFAGIIPIVVGNVLDDVPVTINGDGMQTRDFLFVTDTAEAAIQLVNTDRTRGRVINVASGTETSMNDLVAEILGIMDAPEHPVLHGPPRPGDVRRHCGDVSAARELIGFRPRVPFSEALATTVSWYVERHRAKIRT